MELCANNIGQTQHSWLSLSRVSLVLFAWIKYVIRFGRRTPWLDRTFVHHESCTPRTQTCPRYNLVVVSDLRVVRVHDSNDAHGLPWYRDLSRLGAALLGRYSVARNTFVVRANAHFILSLILALVFTRYLHLPLVIHYVSGTRRCHALLGSLIASGSLWSCSTYLTLAVQSHDSGVPFAWLASLTMSRCTSEPNHLFLGSLSHSSFRSPRLLGVACTRLTFNWQPICPMHIAHIFVLHCGTASLQCSSLSSCDTPCMELVTHYSLLLILLHYLALSILLHRICVSCLKSHSLCSPADRA